MVGEESRVGFFFTFLYPPLRREEIMTVIGLLIRYAANLPQLDDLDSDDEEHDHENCDSHEEDSDEEEDLTKEIDLESEDEGRKRGGKRVRKH